MHRFVGSGIECESSHEEEGGADRDANAISRRDAIRRGRDGARRRAVYFACRIGCNQHNYSLPQDKCLLIDLPLQIHVRSLQNDYAADPQDPSTYQDMIQLDVKPISRIPVFPRTC